MDQDEIEISMELESRGIDTASGVERRSPFNGGWTKEERRANEDRRVRLDFKPKADLIAIEDGDAGEGHSANEEPSECRS